MSTRVAAAKSSLLILLKFEILENIRNGWIYLYFFVSFAGAAAIMQLSADEPIKATASLLSLSLLMIPLFSLLFSGLAFSESMPFLETVIVRQVSRRDIYISKFFGLGLGMGVAYLTAFMLAALISFRHAQFLSAFILMLIQGFLMHFIFCALAMAIAGLVRRREVLIALLLIVWFYFYIIYDLIIMTVGVLFGDYPIEGAVLGLFFLNPLDLMRMIILLNIDLSSLLGFGAALFQNVFGGVTGTLTAIAVLVAWIAMPFFLGLRLFLRRDL